MNDSKHIEFEHKFLVDESFDREVFRQLSLSFSPVDSYQVEVQDRYFFSKNNGRHIYRHRKDERLNQLTYKTSGTDSEKRTEVNLNLLSDITSSSVDVFMKSLGDWETIEIQKSVDVFYFDDVEVVFYVATSSNRTVRCVEFEVREYKDDQSARETLSKYESMFKMSGHHRENRSLLEMFLNKSSR